MDQTFIESPIGRLALRASTAGVRSIEFDDAFLKSDLIAKSYIPHLTHFVEELTFYFSGELTSVTCRQAPRRTDFHLSNLNPIPNAIPCHRVIGADRYFVGFAGGLWRKQWLLKHESVSLSLINDFPG